MPGFLLTHLQDQLADVVSLLVVPAIATSPPGEKCPGTGSLLVVMVFVKKRGSSDDKNNKN